MLIRLRPQLHVHDVSTETYEHKLISTLVRGSSVPSNLFLLSLLSFLFGPLTHLSSQFALCLSVKYFLPSQNHLAAPLSRLWVLISSARLTFCIQLKPNTTHAYS